MSSRSVAQTILEQLSNFGVEFIFGVPGDATLSLMAALAKQDRIQFIATRHESAAAFMASAYAKSTGKLGVCTATSGPGLANLLNGLADAYSDYAPVLAITGQVPTHKIGTQSKQYVDQQRFVEATVSYTAMVASPKSTIQLLKRAVQTAISQRTVSHLSVPKDLWDQPFFEELIPANPYLYDQPPSSTPKLDEAVTFLKSLKKPMILIGNGAGGSQEEIKKVASKLGAGVIYSLGAKGIVDEQFELLLGGIGEGGSEQASETMQQADGLLIVGAMWYPKTFMPKDIPILQIEKEPAHLHLEKNLHSALIGDAREILESLEPKLSPLANDSWVLQIKEARQRWLEQLGMERNNAAVPLSPAYVYRALETVIDPEAIIAVDTGDHTVWFNRSFRMKKQDILFSGTWRTLGFAIPAANAAKLTYPNRQVVAVVGDGGFAMNMAELATIVRYKLDVKIVLFNNHSFAMEKNKMEYAGLESFGNDLTNPNFKQLAESFGLAGYRISQPDQVDSMLAEAFQQKGPVLVEIMSSSEPTPLSKIKAVAST